MGWERLNGIVAMGLLGEGGGPDPPLPPQPKITVKTIKGVSFCFMDARNVFRTLPYKQHGEHEVELAIASKNNNQNVVIWYNFGHK